MRDGEAEQLEFAQEFYRLENGRTVEPAYRHAHLRGTGHEPESIADPGEFPYSRGIEPDGLRTRPTLTKIYSGLGSPAETNARFRKLVRWGVDMVQIASDLPSQVGYDPDHVMSAGEVGRAGVSIASARDLEQIFDGIPLSSLKRVGMLGNSIGPIALALFVVCGERQGIPRSDYVVDIQNDPLKEYVARGTQFLPMEPAARLACDVVEWCAAQAPHWYPMDICVNHLNAAGAGSTAGTAFALSNLDHYVKVLSARGVGIDAYAPRLQMFLDEREDFFLAIANIRATREVWAHLMRDRYGAQDPRSMALQVTAYGHGRETRVEPLNNIVRIALGSLAYYLAGIQSLYTASYDEVLQVPSDEAVKVSLRTQQIFAQEAGLSLTADPLGGSFYLESLTAEIRDGIRSALEVVMDKGGALACIESGYFRAVITEGAVRRQQRYEAGIRKMVGVNAFAAQDDDGWSVRHRVEDRNLGDARAREVAARRSRREARLVEDVLDGVRRAAAAGVNVVDPVIEAVRQEATIGEISDVFREVYGEWEPERAY